MFKKRNLKDKKKIKIQKNTVYNFYSDEMNIQ